MELRQLRYFITLAETLNFRRAADELHITQPTLSQQISAMEVELGTKLLSRSTRSVELTQEGMELLDGVREQVQQIDRCVQTIRESGRHNGRKKTLHIGVDSFANGMKYFGLVDVLPAFRSLYSDVDIEVSIIDNQDFWGGYRRKHYDISFMIVPAEVAPRAEGRQVLIRRDHFVLSVSSAYLAENAGDGIGDILKKLPLCLLEGDTWLNSYVQDYLRQRNLTFTCLYLKRLPNAFDDYISSGIGVMFDLQGLISQYGNTAVRAVDFEDYSWNMDAVAFVEDGGMQAEANAFIDILFKGMDHETKP